jgi:hypothetical protein
MKPSNTIPAVVLRTAANVLQPYLPGISPEALLDAIHAVRNAAPEKTEKPLTRRECAEILSVSVNSVNRYIQAGYLKAVKISPRLVRISPESVRSLMINGIPCHDHEE